MTFFDPPPSTSGLSILTEQEALWNSFFMLLGLKTDLFSISADKSVIVVNSDHLNTRFCPHVSSRAMKNVLKEIAIHGTLITSLRSSIEKTRMLHGERNRILERWGAELMSVIEAWIRDHVAGRWEETLLSFQSQLRTKCKTLTMFSRCVEIVQQDDLDAHLDLSNEVFVSESGDRQTLEYLIRLRSCLNGSKFSQYDLHEYDLLNPHGRESDEASEPEEAVKEPEKSFYICYVNENRIVSF